MTVSLLAVVKTHSCSLLSMLLYKVVLCWKICKKEKKDILVNSTRIEIKTSQCFMQKWSCSDEFCIIMHESGKKQSECAIFSLSRWFKKMSILPNL